VVLPAFGVKEGCWIKALGRDHTSNVEQFTESWGEARQDSAVAVADRKQFEALHRASTVGRLQPYFLIL